MPVNYRNFQSQIKARTDFRDQTNVPNNAGQEGGAGTINRGAVHQHQVVAIEAQQVGHCFVVAIETDSGQWVLDADEEGPEWGSNNLQVGSGTRKQVVFKGQVAIVEVVDADDYRHLAASSPRVLDLGQEAWL